MLMQAIRAWTGEAKKSQWVLAVLMFFTGQLWPLLLRPFLDARGLTKQANYVVVIALDIGATWEDWED